jgi:hypothetical protein
VRCQEGIKASLEDRGLKDRNSTGDQDESLVTFFLTLRLNQK